VLVNNAGIMQKFSNLSDVSAEDVARILEVNLGGPIAVSAAAIPHITRKWGRIINMASQYGVQGRPGFAIYCASKAGVIGMTQSLALELAAEGITVNAVCPGTHLTGMLLDRFHGEAEEQGLPPEAATRLIDEFAEATIPVGRIGTAEDVGAIVAWIASPDASFSTGASFNVAGGETLF
ncbi:MAG: SDR family NAD(P)-dependent oxidoreductase, partial [Myxococcota bacterium]